jgi:hypothetical protein
VGVDDPGFDPIAARAMYGAVAARSDAREYVLIEVAAYEVVVLDARVRDASGATTIARSCSISSEARLALKAKTFSLARW